MAYQIDKYFKPVADKNTNWFLNSPIKYIIMKIRNERPERTADRIRIVRMWRSIEVVITGRTRNAFVGEPARGFESHLLRQIKCPPCAGFLFGIGRDSNVSDPRSGEQRASGTLLARWRDSDGWSGANPTFSAK